MTYQNGAGHGSSHRDQRVGGRAARAQHRKPRFGGQRVGRGHHAPAGRHRFARLGAAGDFRGDGVGRLLGDGRAGRGCRARRGARSVLAPPRPVGSGWAVLRIGAPALQIPASRPRAAVRHGSVLAIEADMKDYVRPSGAPEVRAIDGLSDPNKPVLLLKPWHGNTLLFGLGHVPLRSTGSLVLMRRG